MTIYRFKQAGVQGVSFNYSRYSYIVEKLNSLTRVLSEANEDNYMSFKVQDTLCRVIQEANRVNTYIRHHKNKQGKDILMFKIEEKEMVNHPSHYNMGKYEAIDVIEDWGLGFNLGNTIKYISRAGHKDSIVQDLKKAMWYLDREIQRLENK